MDDGMKLFMKIALIVLIAGVSLFGITKANTSQKDAVNKIDGISTSIWDEAEQEAGK